jgi:hypothetical protein
MTEEIGYQAGQVREVVNNIQAGSDLNSNKI